MNEGDTQTFTKASSGGADSSLLGVSIRAWIVVLLATTVCIMAGFGQAVEEPLYSGFMLSLGYYFGNKTTANSTSLTTK